MFARLLIAAVLAALVAPGVAEAHHTAVPVVALDYRNHVLAASEPAGVHASVEDAGRKLRLTVAPGHEIVVAGYEGERFLYFLPSGVWAAKESKTAQSLRLVARTARTMDGVVAEKVVTGRSFAWADARAWAPSAALHGRDVVRWSVPITVDGRRTAIRGELTRALKPALWPWLVLAALPLVAAMLAVRRRRRLSAAATGLAALAGLATLADLGGFATGGLSVSTDRWFLLAVEVAFTVVLLWSLAWPRVRLIAIATLAAFAVLQALSELAVFRHGVVVSGLPADAVRAAAALALGAGIAAAALVFLVPTPQTRKAVSNVRIPRKEQA